MIDTSISDGGEEYLAYYYCVITTHRYNVNRWGSDSWVKGLKKSAEKDGAPFSNWKFVFAFSLRLDSGQTRFMLIV